MRMNKLPSPTTLIDALRQTMRSRQPVPASAHVDLPVDEPQSTSAARRDRGVSAPVQASQAAWSPTEWGETAFEPRAV